MHAYIHKYTIILISSHQYFSTIEVRITCYVLTANTMVKEGACVILCWSKCSTYFHGYVVQFEPIVVADLSTTCS